MRNDLKVLEGDVGTLITSRHEHASVRRRDGELFPRGRDELGNVVPSQRYIRISEKPCAIVLVRIRSIESKRELRNGGEGISHRVVRFLANVNAARERG